MDRPRLSKVVVEERIALARKVLKSKKIYMIYQS